jgi:hypothetical protein
MITNRLDKDNVERWLHRHGWQEAAHGQSRVWAHHRLATADDQFPTLAGALKLQHGWIDAGVDRE